MNQTKLGLKLDYVNRLHTLELRLNQTKLGLKLVSSWKEFSPEDCLNQTKLGLKRKEIENDSEIRGVFESD